MRGFTGRGGHRGFVDEGGAGGGGISTITSDTLVVTEPTPGTVEIENPSAAIADEILLCQVQMGIGNPETPDAGLWTDPEHDTEFYIGSETDADHALQHGTVAGFFPVHRFLSGLRFVGWTDRASLPSTDVNDVVATLTVDVLDQDGTLTPTINHEIHGFLVERDYFDVQTEIDIAPGQAVAVRILFTSNLADGGQWAGAYKVYGLADTDEGPFISEDLTVWRESISDGGFDLTLDGDGVLVIPNRASTGPGNDEVADPDQLTLPTLEAAALNAQPAVVFSGEQGSGPLNQRMIVRSLGAGTLAPAVSPTQWAGAHVFWLGLVPSSADHPSMVTFSGPTIAGDNTARLRLNIPSFVGFTETGRLSWNTVPAFPGANIYPDPLTAFTNQVALFELRIDAATGAADFLVNGELLATDTTDLGPTPTLIDGDTMGSDGGGINPANVKWGATMVYKAAITPAQAAKTRAYLRGRFGLS